MRKWFDLLSMRAAGLLTFENWAQAPPVRGTRLTGCVANVGQRTDARGLWAQADSQQALKEASTSRRIEWRDTVPASFVPEAQEKLERADFCWPIPPYASYPLAVAQTEPLDITDAPDSGGKLFKVKYLQGGDAAHMQALKTATQVGVCTLECFWLLYRERFDILGVGAGIEALKPGL